MYHMLLPPQLDGVPDSELVLVGPMLVPYLEQVPVEGTYPLYDPISCIRSKSSGASCIVSNKSAHSDEILTVGAL